MKELSELSTQQILTIRQELDNELNSRRVSNWSMDVDRIKDITTVMVGGVKAIMPKGLVGHKHRVNGRWFLKTSTGWIAE